MSAIEETWGREEDPAEAVRRILDAAAVVFVERGVDATRMNHVADAAGCSRGTLYRYFPDRDALRHAYVEREARRMSAHIATRLDGITDPSERLTTAILAAVDAVRADPVLAVWFDPTSSVLAGRVARGVDTLTALVEAFVDTLFADADPDGTLRPGVDRALAADWIVRVVLSLLTHPADGRTARARADRERALITSFVVPTMFASST